MSLSANRCPPSDQVRGHASPGHALASACTRWLRWRLSRKVRFPRTALSSRLRPHRSNHLSALRVAGFCYRWSLCRAPARSPHLETKHRESRARAVHGYPLRDFIQGYAQSRRNCRIVAVLASKCLPTVNVFSACEGCGGRPGGDQAGGSTVMLDARVGAWEQASRRRGSRWEAARSPRVCRICFRAVASRWLRQR
jgi:hypothetical protein